MLETNTINKNQTINKNNLLFGLVSVFLTGITLTIITPVIPFLVAPYTNNSAQQVIAIVLLTSVHALCVFLAAPGLGSLSDRFGRKPIFLISFLGSALGYILFGIGGALWVLIIGRILDGLTGGNISIIYTYFADITPPEKRTKYFGWIGAAAGLGVIIGPILGGLLANLSYSIPVYLGAILSFTTFMYGLLYMPETLKEENKIKQLKIKSLNPFTQFIDILSIRAINTLLLIVFLVALSNGSFQAIFPQFTIDTFNWQPILIGFMLSILGIQEIISQSLIMPRLIKHLNNSQIIMIGMFFQILGYITIGLSALLVFYPFFILGMFLFAFGDSIFIPAYISTVSLSVEHNKQGKIQGGIQSIQSLARIIGPILGGLLYISFGHISSIIMNIILISIGVIIIYNVIYKKEKATK